MPSAYRPGRSMCGLIPSPGGYMLRMTCRASGWENSVAMTSGGRRSDRSRSVSLMRSLRKDGRLLPPAREKSITWSRRPPLKMSSSAMAARVDSASGSKPGNAHSPGIGGVLRSATGRATGSSSPSSEKSESGVDRPSPGAIRRVKRTPCVGFSCSSKVRLVSRPEDGLGAQSHV
ncbi:hypothetical protein JCM24511_05408 [Saitozyma sp. JCM 24511]|nr:hypothetical protein JCM24511_05408 [Saitozyma sp. JCM 24511]